MPKYFFHLRNGGILEEDPEGSEFENDLLAKEEAIRAAREILAEKVQSGDIIDGQQFELVADDGRLVAIVPLRSALRLD